MNQEQVLSLVRAILLAGGSMLATKGYMALEISEPIIGLIMMAIPIGWSICVHTHSNAVAVAAAIPEVIKVEVKDTPAGVALKNAAGSKPNAQVTIERAGP